MVIAAVVSLKMIKRRKAIEIKKLIAIITKEKFRMLREVTKSRSALMRIKIHLKMLLNLIKASIKIKGNRTILMVQRVIHSEL